MKTIYKGAIALTLSILEVSLWSIFLEIGGSSIGIIPELFYAFLIGSIASLAISLTVNKGKGLMKIVSQPSLFGVMLIAGLLNDAFTQIFLGIGTLGTNPSIGSIVYRSWPILVALLTPLVLRQKVRKTQYFAIFIGFLGVYVILSGGTLFSISATQTPYIGTLIIAAFCSASSILMMSKYNADTTGTITIFNVSSFIAMSALVLVTHASIAITFTPTIIFTLLFLGIIAYAAGTMLYYFSLKALGSLIPSNVALTVPFLTIFFSFLIVGTQIRAYYIIAAILIGTGVVLQSRHSKAIERATSKKPLEGLTIFDITSAFASNRNVVIVNQILGGNRALAIKLREPPSNESLRNQIFGGRGCIAFTNEKPHEGVGCEEIDSISEAMGLKDEETALIALGDPEELEDAFEEFVRSQQGVAGLEDQKK